MVLSEEGIAGFIEQGELVVKDVLSKVEVDVARKSFHDTLLKHGCDVSNLDLTASQLSTLSSTNGSGGVLDVFYEPWKLPLAEHPKVVAIMQFVI